MINNRLFELAFGLLSLTAAVQHHYYFDVPDIQWISANRPQDAAAIFYSALTLLIFGGLTALGSTLHALINSRLGFLILIIGSAPLLLFYGIFLFSFGAFYYYRWSGGLLFVMPGIFAALSVYFAFQLRRTMLSAGS